jgi:hypothetical protein
MPTMKIEANRTEETPRRGGPSAFYMLAMQSSTLFMIIAAGMTAQTFIFTTPMQWRIVAPVLLICNIAYLVFNAALLEKWAKQGSMDNFWMIALPALAIVLILNLSIVWYWHEHVYSLFSFPRYSWQPYLPSR